VFCIRERDENNKLVDLNTITFVALHELAHVMTVSIGHTKEFWDNFAFLLEFAVKKGYYKYHPYHKKPVKYCATMITDTPYKPPQLGGGANQLGGGIINWAIQLGGGAINWAIGSLDRGNIAIIPNTIMV